MNEKKFTGVCDIYGDEINIGDIVIVKSKQTDGKVKVGIVCPRDDGRKGFKLTNIDYQGVIAVYDDSCDGACYECVVLNN